MIPNVPWKVSQLVAHGPWANVLPRNCHLHQQQKGSTRSFSWNILPKWLNNSGLECQVNFFWFSAWHRSRTCHWAVVPMRRVGMSMPPWRASWGLGEGRIYSGFQDSKQTNLYLDPKNHPIIYRIEWFYLSQGIGPNLLSIPYFGLLGGRYHWWACLPEWHAATSQVAPRTSIEKVL